MANYRRVRKLFKQPKSIAGQLAAFFVHEREKRIHPVAAQHRAEFRAARGHFGNGAVDIDIDDFPAVKKHLLTFGKNILIQNDYTWVAENYLEEWCYKRLEQNGAEIEICSQKIKIASVKII